MAGPPPDYTVLGNRLQGATQEVGGVAQEVQRIANHLPVTPDYLQQQFTLQTQFLQTLFDQQTQNLQDKLEQMYVSESLPGCSNRL